MAEIKSFCARAYTATKLCTYCNRRFSIFAGRFDSKVKDFIVPLSRGGVDIPENIVASCKECCVLKGDYLNYDLLPLLLNRPRLIGDIKRYLREVRQIVGSPSTIVDLSR
jgi:5-methylcytosine-specific restriction endonuclease McrA